MKKSTKFYTIPTRKRSMLLRPTQTARQEVRMLIVSPLKSLKEYAVRKIFQCFYLLLSYALITIAFLLLKLCSGCKRSLPPDASASVSIVRLSYF